MRYVIFLILSLISINVHAQVSEEFKARQVFIRNCRQTYNRLAQTHGVQVDFNQNLILLHSCAEMWDESMSQDADFKKSTIFKADIRGCEAGYTDYRQHFDANHTQLPDAELKNQVNEFCLGKGGV